MTATENHTTMFAYCGKAVYADYIRCTEEGVDEFRDAVVAQMAQDDVHGHTLLISIPGGKA